MNGARNPVLVLGDQLDPAWRAFDGFDDEAIHRLEPERLNVTEVGEWRVEQVPREVARSARLEHEVRSDCHFLRSREQDGAHFRARKRLRLEFFHRELRRRHGLLLDGDRPVGGAWNSAAAILPPGRGNA